MQRFWIVSRRPTLSAFDDTPNCCLGTRRHSRTRQYNTRVEQATSNQQQATCIASSVFRYSLLLATLHSTRWEPNHAKTLSWNSTPSVWDGKAPRTPTPRAPPGRKTTTHVDLTFPKTNRQSLTQLGIFIYLSVTCVCVYWEAIEVEVFVWRVSTFTRVNVKNQPNKLFVEISVL